MNDEQLIREIQREGAEALLDTGVSVPLLTLKLPWRKKPVELLVTMKRPCMSGQIRIARTYLTMGVTSEQMWRFTKEEQMRFLSDHGKKLSRLIAYTICRRGIMLRARTWIMSWLVRRFMSMEHQIGAILRFVMLLGTDPFMPIIRSAERRNPMKLRLSQKKRGS